MNRAEKGRTLLRPYNYNARSRLKIGLGRACGSFGWWGDDVVGAEAFLGVIEAVSTKRQGGFPKRRVHSLFPSSRTQASTQVASSLFFARLWRP
jgi:hypothetical protein